MATMIEGLVLHPAADLVESGVRELHAVERIGDLYLVGELSVAA